MTTKIENKDICKECGGYCCKKSGCDYFVSDLYSVNMDYIENLLDTGRVSIVSALSFVRSKNNKLIPSVILYLRSRNINREDIDLLSFKTTCASLTDEGCFYDLKNRPSGGASLIPSIRENKLCCYSIVNRIDELLNWVPYQTVLHKIVKKRTGMDVYSKLKQDVKNLFYDIINENFQGVAKEELIDVVGMLQPLCEVYEEEYQKALIRKNKVKSKNEN